jgi:autotransporter-associated beta strand protein
MRGSIWRAVLVSAVFSAVIAAGAGSAHAQLVIYEPFADSNPSLTGNTPGLGLTGTWSADTAFTVTSGSWTYGALPTSGNQVTVGSGNVASSVGIGSGLNNTLGNAGLLGDGVKLWFSVVVHTPFTGGINADTGFALGTDKLGSGNNLPMPTGGQGIGWTIKQDKLQATTWDGALSRTAGPGVATNTTILIVGEITWGANSAASDAINLYLPDTSLNLGLVKVSQTAVLNQANFDTITSSLKTNTLYGFDEIRFGATYGDVIPLPTLYWDLNDTDPNSGSATPAGTWDGAATNWNPLSDGTGATGTWGSGYVARFAAGTDATGTYTVTVDGQRDIWGLTFDEGNVTLAPGTDGELRLTKTEAAVDVALGATATISTPITQDATSRSLIKNGAGTLILSGANTYAGGTNVQAGILRLGSLDALPNGKAVTVGGNVAGMTATLDLDGNSFTIGSLTLGGATTTSAAAVTTGAGTLTLGGNVTYNNAYNPMGATISGKLALGTAVRTFTVNDSATAAADLTVSADISSGAGSGLTKAGAGTLVLSGNNTYTGATTVQAGTLRLGSLNALPSGTPVTVSGTGTGVTATLDLDGNSFTLAGLTLGGSTTSSAAAVTTGAGTLTLGGDVTYASTNSPLGATISGKLELGAPRTFTVNDSATTAADLTVSADISGTGFDLNKAGAGTLVLSGANNYTGTTTVSGGVLQFNSTGAIGGSGRSVIVNSGSAAQFGALSDADIATGMARITTDSAGFISPTNNTAGAFDFNAAGLTAATFGATSAVTYTGTLTPCASAYRVGRGMATLTIGTNLANSGGATTLTKTGTDTVVLSGNNTYTGLTTVSAGTLTLAGDNSSASGGVTLDAGQLNINSAGALGTGTFTIAGGTIDNTSGSPVTNSQTNPMNWNGTFLWKASGNLNLGTGAVTLGNSITIGIYNAGGSILTVGGVITGGYDLTLQQQNPNSNPSVVALTGANNYTGMTAGGNFGNAVATLRANDGVGLPTNSLLQLSELVIETGADLVRPSGNAAGHYMRVVQAGSGTGASGFSAYGGPVRVGFGTAFDNLETLTWGSANFNPGNNSRGLILNQATANNTLDFKTNVNLGGQTGIVIVNATAPAAIATMSGIISNSTGTGSLTKSGVGTLVLSNTNTYNGVTTVSVGTLIAAKAASLPNYGTAAKVVVTGGATVAVRPGDGTTGWSAPQIDSLRGAATWSAATSALGFDTSNGDFSYGSNITQALALKKIGSGTLTLAGANTYTGATTVVAGKLFVNGTHNAASGASTYSVTGTLGGNGTITTTADAVTVNSGGKLAPGTEAAPGTLTLNLGAAALSLDAAKANNAGEFTFRLGAVCDQIVLGAGTYLALGAATATNSSLDWSDFTFIPGTGLADGAYTLIDAGTNATGALSTGVGLLTGPIGAGTGTLSISGGQDLILTVSGLIIPGDTNGDKVVDAADYLAVKQNLGLTTGATLAQGNVDDDGDVDWDDLQVVMTNFGTGASTTPATTPEPCSAMLLVLGAMAVLRRNRRS